MGAGTETFFDLNVLKLLYLKLVLSLKKKEIKKEI